MMLGDYAEMRDDGDEFPHTAEPPATSTPELPLDHRSPISQRFSLVDNPTELKPEHLHHVHVALVKVVRSHRKLEASRQNALLQRDQLSYEQEASVYKRDYYRKSREAFMQHAFAEDPAQAHASIAQPSTVSTDRRHPPVSASQLSNLHNLLNEDHQELEDQDEKVRAIQHELSWTEFYMQNKEKGLADASLQLVTMIQNLGLIAPDDADLTAESRVTTQHSPSTRSASPKLHPALAQYYDKAGDVNVMRERLIEAEAEHRDARTVRILRKEQERPMELPDEEFEADFQRTHGKTVKAYEDAIEARDIARKACLDEDIDPDVHMPQIQDGLFNATNPADDALQISIDHVPPVLIEPFLEGTIAPPYHTIAPLGHHCSTGRDQSSTMLTTMMGNMNEDTMHQAPRHRQRDLEHLEQVHDRIQDWIQTSEIEDIPDLHPMDELDSSSRDQTSLPRSSNDATAPNTIVTPPGNAVPRADTAPQQKDHDTALGFQSPLTLGLPSSKINSPEKALRHMLP